VMAAANGSPEMDRLEAEAIAEVFGPRSVPVASVKGAIGESGAAGSAALVSGLLSLGEGFLVSTVGLRAPDPSCPVCVSSHAQPVRGNTFLVNSVASGGTNYSIAVTAVRPRA